jgi:3-phenylpropionate/trans-cinnamate dioxygenase ferredoxin subunit
MKLFDWHKLEGHTFSDFAENKLTEVTVGAKRIGLLKRNNTIMAFTAACPHAGAPLCEGWIDSLGRIVCPDHKYRFDPVNGRNTTGEGYKLFTYPVDLREDGLYIGIPIL